MAETTRVISNLNDTLPAAPAGSDNVKWQIDRGVTPPNISANVPRADVAGTKYGTIIYDGSDSPTRYLGSDGNWHDAPSGALPSGGTPGQILAISNASPSAPEWSDPSLVTAGAMICVSAQEAANSAYLEIKDIPTDLYDSFILEIENLRPATGDVLFRLYASIDNGANYDTGANYYRIREYVYKSGSGGLLFDAGSYSSFIEAGNLSNDASYGGLCGRYKFQNTPDSATHKRIYGEQNYFNTYWTPDVFQKEGWSGWHLNTGTINALKAIMSSGNIASGKIILYGLKQS